jgi:hypothetical protein
MSVEESVIIFAEYGLTILSLMIMYYMIKFFFVPNDAKHKPNEEWSKRGTGLHELAGKLWEDQKEKSKKNKETAEKKAKKGARESHTDPVRGFLIRGMQHAEHAIDLLRSGTDPIPLSDSKDSAGKALKQFKDARRTLVTLLRRYKGADVTHINELITDADVLLGETNSLVTAVDAIPAPPAPNAMEIGRVGNVVNAIRTGAGHLITEIDKFIETEVLTTP